MVEQNFIIYVNKNKNLRTAPISVSSPDGNNLDLKFRISEKHLIYGLILKGKPIKGDLLSYFPFKPIEKYLFEFSNIHFFVLEQEYNAENTEYHFKGSENNFFGGLFNANDYFDRPPFTLTVEFIDETNSGEYFEFKTVHDKTLIKENVSGIYTLEITDIYDLNFQFEIENSEHHRLDMDLKRGDDPIELGYYTPYNQPNEDNKYTFYHAIFIGEPYTKGYYKIRKSNF